MSNDLNQCQFIGRLGKDPEIRYMADGKAVASFSIAVGSQWKNKDGEKQESTEWVNCTAFDKLGKICGEYLKKGSQVFVSGKMKTEKYTDKAGVEKYTTKIIIHDMQMLGNRQQAEEAHPQAVNQQITPGAAVESGGKKTVSFDDFDSDSIPF